MVWTNHKRSVTFWAWTASITLHLAVLLVFGAAEFSRKSARATEQPAPVAKVSKVERLIQASPVIPKPKVKTPVHDQDAEEKAVILPVENIFDAAKPHPQNPYDAAKAPAASSDLPVVSSPVIPKGVEFFGSRADERKVCYVVDCSGSMQGGFGRVKKELKESIAGLQQDQYFYIIFFGNGRLFEHDGALMTRATQKSKAAAYAFIDSTEPYGRTNAMIALERAIKIRDSSGAGPSIIYFLTDGFDLIGRDSRKFALKTAELLKQFAPKTRINTIGFWPAGNDIRTLKEIAEQSGGEFTCITEITGY
jgi:hypothetical protein